MGECSLCPRKCAKRPGFCGAGDVPRVAKVMLHKWEEPCVSGTRGSGAVFFSGCTLGCEFCQNRDISRGQVGEEYGAQRLAETFLDLQREGAHNINLVTPTHYLPAIAEAVRGARTRGLTIPVVSNNGGYELAETVERYSDVIDVWLTDLKYFSPELSRKLSRAPDYFENASRALKRMCELSGKPEFDADGMIRRGVIIRHLVLPGQKDDSLRLIDWMSRELPKDGFLLSLMAQYTPPAGMEPPLSRRITSYEYGKVVGAAIDADLTRGYMQERSAAKSSYTPDFLSEK